ncbi:MAG: hypothetical protein ACFB51_13735 [Anaerolineae bacterium]
MYQIAAIPLSRQSTIDFLLPPQPDVKGIRLQVVGPRPTPEAERSWLQRLADDPDALMAIDNPHHYLHQTTSDRLVPIPFLLDEDDYLTRNLGGWAPVYFNAMALPAKTDTDPVLRHTVVLAEHDPHIRYRGARQPDTHCELGLSARQTADAILDLHREAGKANAIERVYDQRDSYPSLLVYDVLLGLFVRLERDRRAKIAAGDNEGAAQIDAWYADHDDRFRFILKGEYIMGRHRCSMILLLPQEKVVIKQPGPEPEHEAELGAATDEAGREENWPRLTGDGLLVTPRGRVQQTVDEAVVPTLYRVFEHEAFFSTLTGLAVEAYVDGPTLQEAALADPDVLTPDLYDYIVLHQQVCEVLGFENGDWHSANFVERPSDGTYVHIDWGAARHLASEEKNAEDARTRLNQVENLAYSFHDEQLAERVRRLHTDLLADPDRLARIRERAEQKASSADW